MNRKVRKRREDRYPGIFEDKSHKPKTHTKPNVTTSRKKRIRWCHPVFWKLLEVMTMNNATPVST